MKEQTGWKHWQDLPKNLEQETMDKMANFFVDHDLSLVARLLLETGEPVTRMFAVMGMGLFGPFLEFFEVDTVFAFFRKDGNVEKLLQRIEELEAEKKKEKRDN